MKHTVLAVIVILSALLVSFAPAQAEVNNVTLSPIGECGATGAATTIVGSVGGDNPYYNMELNARMDQAPPENMVYEAWLVDNDTNYKQSVGAFSGMNLNARQSLVSIAPFDAIAVSIEPANDTDPAPSTLVASGNLPGTTVSAANFSTSAVLPANETFQTQLVAQRTGLSSDQVMNLRMQGWSFEDISLAANIAARCNRSVNDVASMLSQGMSIQDIANSCNTTVAMLLTPAPTEAVAGFRGELPQRPVRGITFYRMYPNDSPVITESDWRKFYNMGYSWRDVAVAANIAAETGERPSDLLYMTRVQGKTWAQIAMERSLDVKSMLNTEDWPFGERPGETMMMPGGTMPEETMPSETMPGETAPSGEMQTPSNSY
ncbi:MAG: anti-sigma factor [Armatimonadota bacterium]